MSENYYDTLGLPQNAPAERIEAVARQQIIAWRNRKNNAPRVEDRDEAERHYELLIKIKDVLTDPAGRAKYDAELGGDQPDKAPTQTTEEILRIIKLPPNSGRKLKYLNFNQPQPQPPPQISTEIPIPNQSPTLSEIIVGTWSIQLSSPYVFGVVTQIMTFTPQWQFNGYQVGTPRRMSGAWTVAGAQLMVNGQEMTFWPMTQPFGTIINFTFVSPAELRGTNSFSEYTIWRRVG